MESIFQNGSDIDGREILIKIEDRVIAFYFYEQYLRHIEWVNEETELRLQIGREELSEDEVRDSEFYWIDADQWKKDLHNWHEHMNEKRWFTPEMETFMDKNT